MPIHEYEKFFKTFSHIFVFNNEEKYKFLQYE